MGAAAHSSQQAAALSGIGILYHHVVRVLFPMVFVVLTIAYGRLISSQTRQNLYRDL